VWEWIDHPSYQIPIKKRRRIFMMLTAVATAKNHRMAEAAKCRHGPMPGTPAQIGTAVGVNGSAREQDSRRVN
jgi:hypothetical protein